MATSSSSSTTLAMALDTTTCEGVLKLQLNGENDKIVEFPVEFLKYSKSLSDMIDDLYGGLDEMDRTAPIEIPGRIGSDFMNFYLKYCSWMKDNAETVGKRYKDEEKDGKTTHKFDVEFEMTDWEKNLFIEMNDSFETYKITDWERNFFRGMGQQITVETRDLKNLDKEGKPSKIETRTYSLDSDEATDEDREYFKSHGMKIVEKTPEKVIIKYKEYIDDPYQCIWTSIFCCIDYFDNEIMDQATKKFVAQYILPYWTPKELKALGQEKFDSMNFKERYSEYDSNRDKLAFDKIDETEREALPKRNSKEIAHLTGRTWIKNPHATEDAVEYLNDPNQIYTLVCEGPSKCYAKDCPNYSGASPDKKEDDKDKDNNNDSDSNSEADE